jgi:hypothetical protein
MSSDEGQISTPQHFLEDTVARYFLPWHFISCWRGERGVVDTLLASVVANGAVNITLYLLNDFAQTRGLLPEFFPVLTVLALVGISLLVTWFVVSMWRSARHDFLRGRRISPVVASLIAAGSATAFLAYIIVRFIGLLTILG